MAKWGIRSMIWYIFILFVAFLMSLYYYLQLINDPNVKNLFY